MKCHCSTRLPVSPCLRYWQRSLPSKFDRGSAEEDSEADAPAKAAAGDELDGSFLKFMCLSMSALWQQGPDPALAAEDCGQLLYVQFHAAMLLGLLLYQCAELRTQALLLVDQAQLQSDLARAVDFYEQQGLLHSRHLNTLKDVIRSLCT